MRYGDPEHQSKLDLISTIPSNKIDDVQLKNISDDAMDQFNEKHLRDLREQVLNYDDDEAKVVAEAIVEKGWTYAYNALGDYFQMLHNQKEAIRTINNA